MAKIIVALIVIAAGFFAQMSPGQGMIYRDNGGTVRSITHIPYPGACMVRACGADCDYFVLAAGASIGETYAMPALSCEIVYGVPWLYAISSLKTAVYQMFLPQVVR